MTAWGLWARAVLAGIGAPVDDVNLTSLWNWSNKESGPNVMRWNNPLNTTRNEPNAIDENSVGVKAYPTMQEGCDATVATLLQAPPLDYTQIVNNLRGSVPHEQWSNAGIDLARWGTGSNWLNWVLIPATEDMGLATLDDIYNLLDAVNKDTLARIEKEVNATNQVTLARLEGKIDSIKNDVDTLKVGNVPTSFKGTVEGSLT
jgi:hypothetical protein